MAADCRHPKLTYVLDYQMTVKQPDWEAIERAFQPGELSVRICRFFRLILRG